MQGIESRYCDICCGALIAAWRALMEAKAVEALKKVKHGKDDTIALDAIPELIIGKRIREFDRHALFVTEELGIATRERWPTDSDPERQPLMFLSDPTDRSKYFTRFIEKIAQENPTTTIGELIGEINPIAAWEEIGQSPASITGATGAITCIRKGKIVFTVILNYITKTIFVAVPDAAFRLQLPDYFDPHLDDIDFSHIVKHGLLLSFPSAGETCRNSADDYKRFVSFLGKSGYQENFDDSMIFVDSPADYLHHTEPGGPARILYLSELQIGSGPIGFILANGEKITEWIHWLAFVKFVKDKQGNQSLKVFEISIERPWTKDGILMSTSPPYSIFSSNETANRFLDISRLSAFENPSKFRSMLVIMPADNERMTYIMGEHGYREVGDFI